MAVWTPSLHPLLPAEMGIWHGMTRHGAALRLLHASLFMQQTRRRREGGRNDEGILK